MNKSIFAFFSLVLCTIEITAASFCVGNIKAPVSTFEKTDDKVVMVIVDYLDIKDINKMEFMSRLADESHMALMNNRQPGKAGAEKSKLIIGSGKKIELNENMASGGSEESFLNLYRIVSGREPVKGSLVYTDIYKLKQRNNNNEYFNYIGYLGEVINNNNGSACVLGNADNAVKNRSSLLVAMDSNGMVDTGEIDNILIEDELFPYGRRTDYNRLAELYKQFLPASSFIVIDTGDMERLEAFRASMSEVACESYKNTVLKNIDSFMENIVSSGGFKTLIFISTYPSKSDMEKNNRLTPVMVYEAGEGGLLYSANTRREGIVLNTDIADFIIQKLGYAGSSEIKEIEKENALYYLEENNEEIARVSRIRTPVLTTYAIMLIAALLILFTIAVFFRKKQRGSISSLGRTIAYIILAFPVVFLYMPSSFTGDNPVRYFFYSAAAAAVIAMVLQILLKDRVKIAFSICMLLLTGLSLDILAGSPFIKQSVLGYDPEIGARFYGIGNEYAGMFIGCSLAVAGSIQELKGNKLNRISAALFYAACTLLLGLTFLGANFGGALAGAAGYILAYFMVYGIKFNIRNTFIGVIILATTAAVLVTADFLGISSQSHMGRLVEDAGSNGLKVITSTIQRKITMNLRLIKYTIWTKVLLSIIAMITFMFYRPAKMLQKLFDSNKYMKCSWMGIAASGITGFAVNDSGIVVAATAMIYVAFTMLIMCMGERNEN